MDIRGFHFTTSIDPMDFYNTLAYIGLNINQTNSIQFSESSNSQKVCCIGLVKNKIRVIGINKYKTNAKFPEYSFHKKQTTHAEIDMLLSSERKRTTENITDIIIVRGIRKLLDSYPCRLCYSHLNDKFDKAILHYYYQGRWQSERLERV